MRLHWHRERRFCPSPPLLSFPRPGKADDEVSGRYSKKEHFTFMYKQTKTKHDRPVTNENSNHLFTQDACLPNERQGNTMCQTDHFLNVHSRQNTHTHTNTKERNEKKKNLAAMDSTKAWQ